MWSLPSGGIGRAARRGGLEGVEPGGEGLQVLPHLGQLADRGQLELAVAEVDGRLAEDGLPRLDVVRHAGAGAESPVLVLPAMPTCEQIMAWRPTRQLWAIITRLSIFVPAPITVGP